MENVVVRKRSRDRDFVCTSYFVPEPNYRFTLEGCNEYAEGVIRDAQGDVLAILKPGEKVDISRPGKYLVCIEGRNALGTIFAQWVVPPSVTQHEDCCEELRVADNALKIEIDKMKRLTNALYGIEVVAGENVEIVREDYKFRVSAVDTVPDVDKAYVDSKFASIQDKDTITTVSAGENVSIVKNGNDYQISAADTKPDVTKAYVDSKFASIQDKDTITTVSAGYNISVVRLGDNYTVSAPHVATKIYVDEELSKIQDKDTITTISAGENVTVTKNGNDYVVSAVDTKPDVDKAYVDSMIAAIEDKDTITTVSAGENVTVTKSGNDYQVSAMDTITTVSAGENVTVTKSGNDYRISAADTKPDVDKAYVDEGLTKVRNDIPSVAAGTNVSVVKNGNTYTISSTDTIPDVDKAYVDSTVASNRTVVSAGTNVSVTKNGNTYTVSAVDTVPDVDKAYVDSKIASSLVTVSGGNNVNVTKNGNDYRVNFDFVLDNDVTSHTNIGNIRYGQIITKGTPIAEVLRMMLKEVPRGYEPLDVIHIKQTSSPQRPYFDTGMVFKPGKQSIETYGGVEPGEMGSFLTAVESTSMRGGFHLYGESNRVQFYWGNVNRGLNVLPTEQANLTKLNKFTMGCTANNIVEFSVGSFNDTFTFNSQHIDYTSTATWKVFNYPVNTEIKWGFVANIFFIKENGVDHKFEFLRRKSDNMIVLYDHFNSREIEPIGDASLLEEYTI